MGLARQIRHWAIKQFHCERRSRRPISRNADTFAYNRRVVKIAADGTHTFLYDGWRPLVESIVRPDSTTDRIDYVWGKDISGSLDGAAGIGGLLYVRLNGAIFVPFYDAYGNVMGYRDAEGNTVAEYVYDAFGRTVAQNGTMVDMFTMRYSTKYYDAEAGLYYYGKRYYSPAWRRWLTRDPIGEEGGANLYGFCGNKAVARWDADGRAYFALRKLKGFVWMGPLSSNPLSDWLNIEIAHELVFLEDGGSPGNFGYSDHGVGQESLEDLKNMRYYISDRGYNDCIMRKAIAAVPFKGHDYSVVWLAGHLKKCNCQDYCSALRRKYKELSKDPKVRCECKKK